MSSDRLRELQLENATRERGLLDKKEYVLELELEYWKRKHRELTNMELKGSDKQTEVNANPPKDSELIGKE